MTHSPALTFPVDGEVLAASQPSEQTLMLLSRRRSASAKLMTGPGPDPDELDTLLTIAARVPDHGKLFPWRFILFDGEARADFGAILEQRLRELDADGPPERYQFERERFLRAPLVVAVISQVTPGHKIPVWEQRLSAGAVCFNMLVAANAMGYAAQWLTEWYAYDTQTRAALGLEETEAVAGFIYVGTATEPPVERPRKAPQVSRWTPRSQG